MPLVLRVDGAVCPECGTAAVCADVVEEATGFKVGATCGGCGRDFGVLTRISRSDVDTVDAAHDRAEQVVRDWADDP